MKTRYALLSAVLTIALTLPVLGQETRIDTAMTNMKQSDMSGMMGKPTADATVEGLHMKVWLMTQEQHKAMMKGRMGQMMTQGEKQGAMGRMEMQGTRNPGMAIGKDMKLMKHGGTGMKDTSMAIGKDMKGMQHDGMGMKDTSMGTDNERKGMIQGGRSMNMAMMDSMMAGTHQIRLDVTDAAAGTNIADASARVLIVSPSEKKSSVDLTPMMSHFGGALTLDEKGEYRFTVSVTAGGVSRSTQFQYAVN